MIQPEPQRVLPVTLHGALVPRIIAGRVRLIHLTGARARNLSPGDMLWLREPLKIPKRQPGGDHLAVTYFGETFPVHLRWPRALARPSPGTLPAEAMPVHCSRLTLVASRVTPMRLQQITDDEAIMAGVELALAPVAFCNPLVEGQCFEYPAEAFGHLWDCALGAAALGPDCWTANPEVVAVEFRARSRNIAQLVPGLGSGGAR